MRRNRLFPDGGRLWPPYFKLCVAITKEITPSFDEVISLVGHTRENWNYIFESLNTLHERVEELDIESILGPL